MSRLVIAITGKTLWSTGDVRLWIDLTLLLKDKTGGWQKDQFRVDTGTDITTFPAYRARQLNLPMPVRAAGGATHTQTGLEIRSGLLCFRIDGMDTTEYLVPCFFLGDPNTPPAIRAPCREAAPTVGIARSTPFPIRQKRHRGSTARRDAHREEMNRHQG